MDLTASKQALRRALRARPRPSVAEAARAAEAAAARLCETPEFARAARVALYAALEDELPTRPAFLGVVGAGKQVLLPRIAPGRRLVFEAVDDWGALRAGRYGVLEPPSGSGETAPLAGTDLVVVPGVAFDRAGGRLGRGAGYYDRAFPVDADRAPVLFGLAFERQLVARVPTGPRDRRVAAVVTERALYRAGGSLQ